MLAVIESRQAQEAPKAADVQSAEYRITSADHNGEYGVWKGRTHCVAEKLSPETAKTIMDDLAAQRQAGREEAENRYAAVVEALQLTLEQYANHDNWESDDSGVARNWKEFESATPREYDGWYSAEKALADLDEARKS
jgi:hypothetical protein